LRELNRGFKEAEKEREEEEEEEEELAFSTLSPFVDR
jgi:hypothetical protein